MSDIPGASDWWPGSESDDPTQWWPQPAFTVQRRIAGVEKGGDYVRGSTGSVDGFLIPTVGVVSTPAVTMPAGDITWVFKIRNISTDSTPRPICGQWQDPNQRSYAIDLAQTTDMLSATVSPNGTTSTTKSALLLNSPPEVGIDEYLAVTYPAGSTNMTAWRSTDGESWGSSSMGSTTSSTFFTSTAPIVMGSRDLAQTSLWAGRIYWVECRTGNLPNAGTVLWRFDANEYSGVGTSYVDPRGRTWTLSSSAAIVTAAAANVQKSALRYPTSAEFDVEELVGTGIFYARPLDYGSIEVTWGITLDLAKWNEVAIVRSAFGMPATVNDGQTIYRATQGKLFPNGYKPKDAEGKQPIEARKVFDPRTMPGVGTQVTLPNGRWYYYSLFYRSGLKWHRYMVTSTLLPRNYNHAEHLFNNLPPYYQWMDDNMRGGTGDGDLRKFLKLIGFDFDLTREYVQGFLDLYHTDFTPVPLLRRLGANFGMPYESGLGDIRHRGLISKLGFLYRSRGTSRSLQEMVVSVSKCTTDLTPSDNIMLLPDDSDFFEGTGSWAGIHPDTPLTWWAGQVGPVVPPSRVFLGHGVKVTTPLKPDNSGRGMMTMWTSKADATGEVFITCGDGITTLVDDATGIRTLHPRYYGIPVRPYDTYSFSVQVKLDLQPLNIRRAILWFTEAGDNQDLVTVNDPGPLLISDTNWHTYTAQGTAPSNAFYAVPGIAFKNRLAGSDPNVSPNIYFCAAQFMRIGTAATVDAKAPDTYLSLTGPAWNQLDRELIGPATDTFEGYLVGDPTP